MRLGLGLGLTGGGTTSSESARSVSINNSTGGALTDYPVAVTVTWQAAMKPDFSDLRFSSDAGGTTILSHWIESYTSLGTATVWVKVPSIGAASSPTIYLRYGNRAQAPTSSGANVFSLFDDFRSGLSAWTVTETTADEVVTTRKASIRKLVQVANGNQGLCMDGTNIFFAKDGGAGVDSTIYKYDYAGSAVTSFAGPAHGATIDIRDDNGTLISSSGSTDPAEVWEITKAGVKVREWDFSSTDYGQGAGVTYYGPGQFLLFTSNPSFAFTVRLVTVSDDGSFVLGQAWSSTSLGRPQGVKWQGGYFWLLTDTPPDNAYGTVYKLALNAGGTVSVVQQWDELWGLEREGLTYDGTNWYYGTSAREVMRLDFSTYAELQANSHASLNRFAYVASGPAFGTGFAMGTRAKFDGMFPGVWLADATTSAPASATNNLGLGRLASGDTNLYGRQRAASVQTQQTYTAGAVYKDFSKYEIVRLSGGVTYYRNGSALGAAITTGLPSVDLKVMLGSGTFGQSGGMDLTASYVYVRKAVTTEPVATVGAVV